MSIYRYDMPHSDGGFIAYIREYTVALIMTMYLMVVVLARERYDVIQLCNPPDVLILAALPFKLLGKKVDL